MVVLTRLSKKQKEMAISDEIKNYFTELVSPLVTSTLLKEMLDKLSNDIIEKFNQKIKEQDRKIEQLESTIEAQEKTISTLYNKCDDNEQYARRNCLRIHGIEVVSDESNDDVMKKVENCYSEIGLPFNTQDIDRVHRIGKSYTDKASGKEVKSIIVKFRSWKSRLAFYKSRPKNYENGTRKPGQKKFSVSVDLTKRRYTLLKTAKGLITDNRNVSFAFVDINCSLCLKFSNGSIKHFNSESELNNLL